MEKEIYKRAIAKWGMNGQTFAAIEELSELINELSKGLNGKNKRGEEGLIDEIADVQIMIDQLKIMHDISERVESRKIEKLIRLSHIVDGKIEHPHK